MQVCVKAWGLALGDEVVEVSARWGSRWAEATAFLCGLPAGYGQPVSEAWRWKRSMGRGNC